MSYFPQILFNEKGLLTIQITKFALWCYFHEKLHVMGRFSHQRYSQIYYNNVTAKVIFLKPRIQLYIMIEVAVSF